MAVSENISTRPGALNAPAAATAGEKYRLPIVVVLYILAVVLPMFFNVGPLKLNTVRLLLIVMILPLMIGLFSGRYGKVYAFDYLFVLHILWAIIALSVNNPGSAIQQVGSVGMDFLGGYVLGRAFIRTPEAFIALSKLLSFLVIFLLLPLALFENMTGRAIGLEIIRSLPGIDTFSKVRPDPRMGFFRAQSLFVHSINFGLFCSVVFSLCLVGLKGQIPSMIRYVASCLILLSAFTALSSGALLAAVLQIALFSWAVIFRNYDRRWWLLVGMFVLGYIVIDVLSNRSPLEVFMSYATFSAHNAYWRSIIFEWGLANVIGSAAKGIPASPFFGIGLHDWVRPWFMYSGSMDNFWLVMTVRYGLPGFFFLVLGYVIGIGKIMRRDFTDSPMLTQLRLAWVFTFMGLSFTLCTVHIHTNVYSFVFFMFGAGIWFISAQDTQREPPSDPDEGSAPVDPERARFTRFPQKTAASRGPARRGPQYARS